jgi:protein SCO1/2
MYMCLRLARLTIVSRAPVGSQTLTKIRIIVSLICVLILLGLIGYRLVAPPSPPVQAQTGTVQLGGPFKLVNQDGKAVDQTVLKGKWTAVFFGFTYCPDVCPTTLQTLGTAAQGLGADANKLQIVFISVDPGRDTPKALKAYLASPGFPKNVIGLTGTPDQIAAVAKAYRVYYAKEGEGETYLVNHTSLIYLMNPKGEYASALAYGLSPQETLNQIRQAMGQN